MDCERLIEGVILTSLKKIEHPKGDIFHVLKSSSEGFLGFGEAYFSTIHGGDIKGWKRHKEVTLNLTVAVGRIKFVIYDDRPDSKTKNCFWNVILDIDNYQRLTIAPGLWLGFQGVSENNILLNIINKEHEPSEAESCEIKNISYDWNKDIK